MVTSDENFNAVTSVLKNLNNEDTLKAVSLSDAGIVHGFKDKFLEIESYGIDMIFCNDDEAIAFAGTNDLDQAIEYFKSKPYMTAITKGSEGSVVISNGKKIFSPAVKIDPVDTNGAGDMYAGSFMHAYLNGYDIKTCAEFSNYASSKIVETFGPRLTPEGYTEVINKLKKN